MSVTFDEFVFDNQTGLSVTVTLEAPLGSQVTTYQVGASQKKTFNPGVANVSSLKVRAADASGDHTGDQTIKVDGTPRQSYIAQLESVFNVGSIQGSFKSSY